MNSNTSLNDARLDRAIDRAVREMMRVDPAPGLRRRVLSRINAPVERRALPLLRYGIAAAALAVVVLSITLLPGHVEPPTPPKAPSPIVAGVAPAVLLPAALSRYNPPPVPSGKRASQITKEPIPIPRVTNVFGDRRSDVSAASVREPGAAAPRVAPETLTPLTIVPLSARPLVIEPLVLPALPK
jgi:hypothetical protein